MEGGGGVGWMSGADATVRRLMRVNLPVNLMRVMQRAHSAEYLALR